MPLYENTACVIGTGSWGTTLARMLARKGTPVSLWARSKAEARTLEEDRENKLFLPGFKFPDSLHVTASLSEAVANKELIVIAVPSQRMRETAKQLAQDLQPVNEDTVIVSATKGLEMGTLQRMSRVLKDVFPRRYTANLCALSGPNLSHEIARDLPAATVVASENLEAAERAQQLMMGPRFRVYANTDIVGVELGGALKNIIAIGAGICDGLKIGDNAKSALITRGLAEMVRFATALGANQLTLYGLAGLGDVMATCASNLSRNHFVGVELAHGKSLDDILAAVSHTAEGVPTTRAARDLARRIGVEMPIVEQMYGVMFDDKVPIAAIEDLMLREAKHEMHGMKQ